MKLFDDRYIGKNSIFGRLRARRYAKRGWIVGQYFFKPRRHWWKFW